MTGFAGTVRGLGLLGVLVGMALVFGAVRLLAREPGGVRSRALRDALIRGAIGAGLGAVLVFVLAALTRTDVAPAALGLGGVAAAILVTVLVAVSAALWSPRPVALSPTRRTVVVLAVVLGLFVAVATVGAHAQRTAADQAPAPVLGRVAAQLDALGVLAAVIAGVAILATLAMADRRPLVLSEAGILGLAGAVIGSIAGLAMGAALITLGGGSLDLARDTPWAALGVSSVLGIGLAMASAWLPARLWVPLSEVQEGRFG